MFQAFLAEQHDGVDFLGHVDDVELEYAQAAAVINPIWAGTGLKIKTVEALARGKPLVTTSKGIEGMRGNPAKACAIGDNDDALVEHTVTLLSSKSERTRMSQAARLYAEEFLSVEAVYGDFLAYLDHRIPG